MYLVLVLLCFVFARVCDDGDKVGGVVSFVFVYKLLHAGMPADVDALPGLLTAVGEVVALEVAFLQVGDVGKRHAAGVEAEEEDVACEVVGGVGWQGVGFEFLQFADIDGSLDGLGYACVDVGEGVGLLWGEALLSGVVVDGAKVAHVEGGGVGA